MPNSTLNRRQMLRLSTTVGVAAALPGTAHALQAAKPASPPKASTGSCGTPRTAVASTQYGKVRGYVEDGVFMFKGVPYGATTGGENRWLPAKPPKPWDGELPTLTYGANCPQRLHDWSSEQTFLQQWTDGWQSEDMLKVNIWTPSLTGKRPVMFYIHGGGFTFGSAYELASQDGAQMARHHDVVSVTVNHRLNILGFLDLSEFGGAAYADSVNVGMTDLVAALRWVRDNIANFGGDPDCVMIYGQSGGGSKVTTLLGMPSAQGLIHRASRAVGRRRESSERRAVQGTGQASDGRPRRQGHRRIAEDGVGQAERDRQRGRRQDEPADGCGQSDSGTWNRRAAGGMGAHR